MAKKMESIDIIGLSKLYFKFYQMDRRVYGGPIVFENEWRYH